MNLTCPAPAKLNLFLHVTGRRADGYHLLQTLFRFIDLNDTLHFTLRADGVVRRVNAVVGVAEEQDLCVRAAKLLQAETGCRLGVEIEVEKRIPMGGGLGGGSSDAATTLIALNRMWQLGLTRQRLMQLGLKLGADVPVFVFGQNAFAEGVGEQLQAFPLQPAWYVVLCPPVHVPTAAIFTHPELTRDTVSLTMRALLDGRLPAGWQLRHVTDGTTSHSTRRANNARQVAGYDEGSSLREQLPGGSSRTKGLRPAVSELQLHNDLQPIACKLYPEVAQYLETLNRFGKAMMTGSGACVFAAYASEAEAAAVLQQLPEGMRGMVVQGLTRHPLHDWVAD